jgi:hypothetical protein
MTFTGFANVNTVGFVTQTAMAETDSMFVAQNVMGNPLETVADTT